MTSSLGTDRVGRIAAGRARPGYPDNPGPSRPARWLCGARSTGGYRGRAQRPDVPLPDGFTIELAAGPPLVDRPITAAFDERGRLYVADSSGSNDNVQKQLAEKPHRILRLEDSDGDGQFDRSDRLRRQDDVPRGNDVVRRLALRRRAAAHLEADRHRRRRRGRPARRVVPGQDADRLRQRPARAVSRPRRLDLLVQGGVRQADLRAAGQAAVRHPGGPHLPLPARRHRHRAGHDRRHGQPGRRRLHARRRADLHHHVPRASRRRPARRPDPRDLRRHLRQGPRPDLRARPQVDRPRASCRCCCTWARPPRAG